MGNWAYSMLAEKGGGQAELPSEFTLGKPSPKFLWRQAQSFLRHIYSVRIHSATYVERKKIKIKNKNKNKKMKKRKETEISLSLVYRYLGT